MIVILRKRFFKKGIGHYYMILSLNIFKGKMMTRSLGPYLIEKCHDNGAIQIKTTDAEGIPLLFNGYKMKLYKKPMSKA